MAESVSPGMSVSELMEDLAGVTDWHSLGTHLGLESRQFDVIEQEFPSGVGVVERRKRRVLDKWMNGKTGDPSWRDIVSALMNMGELSIAEEMRRKYSGSVPVKPTASEAIAIAKENKQQIKGEFIKLHMFVCEKLQTMHISMQRFLYFVKGLFPGGNFIPASKKIDDIFEAITRNDLWDFINYSPLRQIAKAFAKNDEEINTAIQEYQHALTGYLAGTKLADYIASMRSISKEVLDEDKPPCARNDQQYFKKLTTKLEAKVTEKSMKYLVELWNSLSEYLLPSLTCLLDTIHEGCVSVVCLVPPSAMPAITLKIDDPETAKLFSKLGIIRMEFDDMCLYEEQETSVETATEHKQEQDSSLEQFPDSQEPETSQGVAKETAEQEQRAEEENDELRAADSLMEVEIGQLRETITGLECKLSQLLDECKQLREILHEKKGNNKVDKAEILEMTIEYVQRMLEQGAGRNSGGQPEVERLLVRDLGPPARAATDSTESQLHPGDRLQWRRYADAPVKMSRPQAIAVGEKVYVGGGFTSEKDDIHKFLQYNRQGNTWSTIPGCPVSFFGLANFMGRIITVGGVDREENVTDKVHSLKEETQQWEEFLSPMPTARFGLSVVTTSEAIIAAGGHDASDTATSAVEVYSSDNSQWHTADPLPTPCAWMSSVTINGICYLLGGKDQSGSAVKAFWSASVQSLVHNVGSGSTWSHLPLLPLKWSSAACLSGSLVSIGGDNDDGTKHSVAYAFLDDSWKKFKLRDGDQLSPLSACATAQLSPLEVMAIGGWYEKEHESKMVFIGTLHTE